MADTNLPPDPHALFEAWFAEAEAGEPSDPNAMTIATVDAASNPSARIVLMKARDERGIVFYTNLHSMKGDALRATGRAEALFHWKSLKRQVRFRGAVTQVEDAEADAYFATRPRVSQLGAWASLQSRPLPLRSDFDNRVAETDARFPGDIPRPPFWSGFRLAPREIEFWQDRYGRLHERWLYRAAGDGWHASLVYP